MKNYDGTKITFRIDEYTAQQLKQIAKKHYLTVSAYIRKCLDQMIQEEMKNV